MFTLNQIVPWGRSFDEYRRMFALSGGDLQSTILGCADGPASFNAEATRHGACLTSCDPIYQYDAREIRDRIDATFDEMIEQTRQNADDFIWDSIASVDDLARLRRAAMNTFLEDYETGKRQGRYVTAELPTTGFADSSFDLAVCSHFLFLYGVQLDEDFHVAAVRELVRVAREVRIFPVLALGAQPSPYVPVVIDAMRRDGRDASIVTVPYEFVRGGNQMMRILNSRL